MLRTKAVYLQIKETSSVNLETALISVGSTVVFGAMPVLLTMMLLAAARLMGVGQVKSIVLDGELLMVSNAIVSAATMSHR